MILADVFGWVFFIAGLAAVFNCCWLASYALWPKMVTRGAQHFSRPFRTTAIGLLVAFPGGLAGIALATQNAPFLKMLGFLVLGALILVGIAGSTSLCLRVGQGLASPADKDRPWKAVLRGGVVLAFVCLFPIIGWIGVLLWMLICGCGVVILPRFSRAQAAVPAPQPQAVHSQTSPPPIVDAGQTSQHRV